MPEEKKLLSEITRLFPFEGRKWGNEPIPCRMEEYESAKKRFIEVFAVNPCLASIYQFGFIRHPGISDLDFLMILNDKPGKCIWKKDIYAPFTQKERYLYNNTPPIIVNKEIFYNFYKILPLSNLVWLSGERVEQHKKKDEEIFNLLILLEVCSHFYPKVFLELFKEKIFNIRRAILLINSLQYPLSIAAGIVGEDEEWNRFNSEVNKLRGEWFLLGWDRYKRLYDLILNAIWISTELIEKTGNRIQEAASKCSPSQKILPVGSFLNGRMLFYEGFGKEFALEGILKTYKRSGKFISILPSVFLSPFMIYKEENGQIGRHIKRNLSVYGDVSPFDNPQAAVERIGLMNLWIDFIEGNRITVDMVHIYYGYRPRVSLKNRLMNLLIGYYHP